MMRRAAGLAFLSLLWLLGPGPVRAEVPLTPAALAGASVVSAAEAVRLAGEGAVVVDVRKREEYEEGRIPGAVHLPYAGESATDEAFDAALDRFDVAALPSDRDRPLLFYCNGPRCWKSYKAAVVALRAGYRRVYWFRGGLPEWEAAGLDLE